MTSLHQTWAKSHLSSTLTSLTRWLWMCWRWAPGMVWEQLHKWCAGLYHAFLLLHKYVHVHVCLCPSVCLSFCVSLYRMTDSERQTSITEWSASGLGAMCCPSQPSISTPEWAVTCEAEHVQTHIPYVLLHLPPSLPPVWRKSHSRHPSFHPGVLPWKEARDCASLWRGRGGVS